MGETHELPGPDGPRARSRGGCGRAEPARPASARRILPVVAALVLVGAGVGGWYWWTVGRFIETTDDAYVQSDIAVISPKVEGYVRAVQVVDNQAVQAGRRPGR